MGLTKRTAYVLFCPECGCHACIVCANGKEGKEFATKAGGLEELAALVSSGNIEKDEALKVRRQIEESDLKPRDDEVDTLFKRFSRAKAALRELIDIFHEEIASCWADENERNGSRPKPQEKRTLH